MLDHALAYARAGLPVIPLHGVLEDGTCTCGDDKCKTPGKHPRTRNGLKAATTDERTIKKWWGKTRWPNASIGGVGGEFLCLDIDAKSDGHRSLRKLIASNAPLPETAVALTGEYETDEGMERGMHYWFRMPQDERVASRAGVRPGIDIRCHNGYAVMPPSPHVSGVNYEWVSGDLETSDIAPEWIIELAPEVVEGDSSWEPDPNFKMSKEVRDFLRGNNNIPPGEQREFLTRASRSVLTTGKPVEKTAELLWSGYNGDGGLLSCDWEDEDPWHEEDVLAIVEDIFTKGPSSPMEKDFSEERLYDTDTGNAKRLIGAYPPAHLHHVLEWGVWYVWDESSRRYIENDGSAIRMKFEEEVTRAMMKEASEIRSEEEAKRLFQHAVRSQSRSRIEAAVWLARDYVALPHTELNSDPFLLSVQNGIVDLRTGELLEATPEHKLTKQARAEYNPKAKSKVWTEFLKSVVPDPDLRDFLQKAFGYTLTGSVEEHKFFYLHGPPASGKSTLLEAFSYLMGNYAESADPSTFMRNPNRSGQGPTEDIARLANARMVVTHEVEAGMQFAEGHLSKLTGNDTVTARFLHQKTFEFQPKFKLWFSANHKPRVTASSRSGLWRRILIVPMEETIPEDKRDPGLYRRLRQPDVQSAILAWAVEGALAWLEDNEAHRLMEVPDLVRAEVEQYKEEEDDLAAFIKECLVLVEDKRGEPDERSRISTSDMFQYYLGWCEAVGKKHTPTQHKFTREFKERGFVKKQMQIKDGSRPDCWYGVKVKGIRVPEGK